MFFDLFSAAPPLRSLSACEQRSQEGRVASTRCCWCCALPSWSRKTNQNACQTPASVSLPRRTCSPQRVSFSHSPPCLRKEDGTVHSASCTRTRGVSERLAAGRLKSTMPCYVRILLLLLCVILIGECRKHRSRKRRWSAPAEPRKPGT